MSSGRVYLVGGGPGAADLVTLRGARAMRESDIVIWGRPLVTEELVREHAGPGAEIIVWPPATMADIEAVYDRAAAERLTVTRLHGGDPGIYARLNEELTRVRSRGLDVEVIPGVTAACAVGAALEWELTSEADRRPVVFVGAQAAAGASSATVSADLARVASSGAALALYMLGDVGDHVQRVLLAKGYPPNTRCGIGHAVSWPGEVLDSCPLSELGECLRDLGRPGSTVVLIAAAGEPQA